MPIIGGGGGGGGGAGGLTTIVDTTLGAPAANFDVTGISQSFIQLLIVLYARADDAATNVPARFRFNNDSGANYYRERVLGNNGGSAANLENAAATAGEIGLVPAATGTAARFGSVQAWVPNYAGATGHKMCTSSAGQVFDNTAGDAYVLAYTNCWISAVAINRVTIFSGTGGNWVAGSRLTLYAL